MKNLILARNPANPIESSNFEQIMRSIHNGIFVGNLPAARFSNPAVSSQNGIYQKLGGIVYIHLEICPDINNPLGGGATVSFTSGDVIAVPFLSIAPSTYVPGQFLGNSSFTLTQLSNGAKFTNCKIRTNTSNISEIQILHNIGATASTFLLEGIYLLRE